MNYQFYFPQISDPFEIVNGIDHLNHLLLKEKQYHQYKLKYSIAFRKSKYIYCKCTSCEASLTFHKQEDSEQRFRLIKFRNRHLHCIKHNKFNRTLISYINQLPKSITLKTAKTLTINQFPGMSQSKFYYYFRKIKSPQLQYKQLIEQLDKSQYQIQSRPWSRGMNQLPQLLMIISPRMKQMFDRYGSFLGFDLTFHTIKQRRDNKVFKIGAFLGLSNCRKIVPYGLAVMLDQKKQSFYQLFKSFGNVMSRHPNFYITDQAAGIKAALIQLRQESDFLGYHILDSFHICRNIRKRLIRKDHLKYFVALLRANNQIQYEKQLANAYEFLEQAQFQILNAFNKDRSMTCYSHLPILPFDGIIGFSCSNSINEKFHDMLKQRIPKELPYTKTVQITINLLQELIQKCEIYQIQRLPIEKYYFNQIKQIRFQLDKKVFSVFCYELPKLLSIEIRSIGKEQIKLYDALLNWNVTVNFKEDQWQCPCIPCAHLIKTCLIVKIPIISLIHSRWMIERTQLKIKQRRTSTGRRSRRNR